MTNELERLVGRLFVALLVLFCVGIALSTAAFAIGALIALLISVIGVWLLIGLAISITIYVYPWVHNGGLALSDRLYAELDTVPVARAILGPRVLFNAVTWMGIVGAGIIVPCAILGDLGISRLSTETAVSMAGLFALCPGAIFGVALTLWPDLLDSPGGGPIARLIEAGRNRFG